MKRKFTKEHLRNLGNAQRGRKHSLATRKKISNSNLGRNKGQVVSIETKRKLSIAAKGRKFSPATREKLRRSRLGKNLSKETKEKLRIKARDYIKKFSGGINPRIGRNEKKILDSVEKSLNIKLIRQYETCGYFVDGYDKKNKMIYEVDEKPKNDLRQVERENRIKRQLNCKFIRLLDY